MAQVTDYTIQDGDGLTVLNDLTATFAAVRDDNAGGTAPPNPVPGMRWRDTSSSPAVLRIRNDANSDWVAFPSSIGGTSKGIELFTAASEAAARTSISAPAIPNSGGVGHWIPLSPAAGVGLQLPAGGTWAYAAYRFNSGVVSNSAFGVAAGGTAVGASAGGQNWSGFAWRIA